MFSLVPYSTPAQRHLRKEGRRLYLRAPTVEDWRAWAELRAKSRTFLTPWEPSWNRDALTRAMFRRRLRQYAEEWRQGVGYSFFLFTRTEGDLIGGISLSNVRRGVSQAGTLGYWVGAPHAGKGFMTEAIELALEFAFGDLDLHRVEAACLPSNEPSKAVLVKNGFQEEGFAPKYLRIDGDWRDHVLFGLVKEDWAFLKRAKEAPG